VGRQLFLGIIALVLGASLACGSNGTTKPEAGPTRSDGGDAAPVSLGKDGGCGNDDSAAAENCRIKNPPPDDSGIAPGGGTPVTRQPPVNYLTCKP
jgi:hypothetical protein